MATCSFDRNIVLTDPKAIDIVNRILEEKKDHFPDAKPRTEAEIKAARESIKKYYGVK